MPSAGDMSEKGKGRRLLREKADVLAATPGVLTEDGFAAQEGNYETQEACATVSALMERANRYHQHLPDSLFQLQGAYITVSATGPDGLCTKDSARMPTVRAAGNQLWRRHPGKRCSWQQLCYSFFAAGKEWRGPVHGSGARALDTNKRREVRRGRRWISQRFALGGGSYKLARTRSQLWLSGSWLSQVADHLAQTTTPRAEGVPPHLRNSS